MGLEDDVFSFRDGNISGAFAVKLQVGILTCYIPRKKWNTFLTPENWSICFCEQLVRKSAFFSGR